MPGINIIKSPYVNSKGLTACEEFKSSFNEVLPHINCQLLYHNENTIIYETNYEYYDQHYEELGEWQISWEGIDHINFESIIKTLNQFTDQEISGESLRAWRDSTFCNCTSGFFFLAHHPKTGIVVFANDDLARFPVYIYHNNGEFFIGREYSLLRLLTKELKPDKLLIALYLLFRYAPGHGSPYKEIDTLECSSLGVYIPNSDKLLILSDLTKRMPSEYYNGDEKTILNDLKDSFVEATDKSLNGRTGLLSLSGGKDSRAVAAALLLSKKPFIGVTHLDADKISKEDVNIAIKLAEHLDFSHEVIELSPENESHFKTLFTIKQGLNYMGATFMINFLEQIRNQYGNNFILLTGDGGDTIMEKYPPGNIKLGEENIKDYILSVRSIFNIKYISNILDLNISYIKEYLFGILNKYPYPTWEEKYYYYVLSEVEGHWIFEAEDRNRYYYPSETPFFNLNFYNLIMSVPPQWKAYHSLYMKFYNVLYPQACDIPFAKEFFRKYNLFYKINENIFQYLRKFQSLKIIVKKINNSDSSKFLARNYIIDRIDILNKKNNIKEIMPNYYHYKNISNIMNYNKSQLTNLYTVFSMINNQI